MTPVVTLWLLTSRALAHGGEDHAHEEPAPAPPRATDAMVTGTASSRALDAVLRIPRPPATGDAVLLLADWATSAPITDASATLSLAGPGSAQATFGPHDAPGIYHGTLALPAPGTWAGALVVTTGSATELLALDGLDVTPDEGARTAPTDARTAWWTLALVGLGGVALGWALGRGRGAAVGATVLAGGALLRAPEVAAHGGEAHADETPDDVAPTATSALVLPLDTQFAMGVRTVLVARDRFMERVPALGALVAAPGDLVTVASPVDGTLAAPPGGMPRPGQRVRTGQLLGTLLEAPGRADRAALAQARADAATALEQARAALALAERDAASVDTLGDALPARERLTRERALASARVAVREAETALSALSGARVPVRAPFAGTLGRVLARPGERVTAGEAVATLRGGTGTLWAEVRVPERDAVGLHAGAVASVVTAATPETPRDAVVLDPGQQVDPATGTVTVTLALPDAGPSLPGGGVTAWITHGTPREALVVPTAAVLEHDGAPFVFVKTAPESFAARPVRLGARSGTSWEVLGGVAPGERVVTAGSGPLRALAGR